MVAAQDHGQRSGLENLAHAVLDIGMAFGRVGMDDIRIADVDDRHLGRIEIGDIVFVVIGPRMTEREQRRRLAYRPRAHARARPPLAAEVKRRAKHGHIGADGLPILDIGVLAKGADAHERQIQTAGLIIVC